MRVAVVTTSYPSSERDPSGHFVETEVRDLERAGADVTVITPRPGGAFGWPGVASRLRERPWRIFEATAWSARAAVELRNARPQRVIAHWAIPSAFPIASGALALGHRGADAVEVEVVSHGGDVRLLAALPATLRTRIVRALVARASTWRFVSESLLTQLAATLDERDEARVRKIALIAPSPLTMIDVREESASRRQDLGGRRLYVCASRLVASKRVDMVIDYVASTTSDRRRERVLVVVGDGPERPRLERLAYRWGLDARFVGIRSRRDTLAWLGAADEVVHASLAEGMSTVLREAEHLGVPVTTLA
jgi:glycosyltransferase involved in cell wall biosynthesis